MVKLSPPTGVPIANVSLEIFPDFSSSEQKLYEATMEVSRLSRWVELRSSVVEYLTFTLDLRSREFVSDSDTTGITSTHAINVDEIEDNARESL